MNRPFTIFLAATIGLLGALAPVGPASAQSNSVPDLNVRPVCRGIAQQAATPGERGGPDLGYRQCVQSEMAMRRKLIRRWARYTSEEKADCIGLEMSGYGSYSDLATCLEMARAAGKLNR